MGVQKNYTRTLLAPLARTANGSLDFTVPFGSKGMFYIDCTLVSGTSPTLDVKVQARDPISGQLYDLKAFTQLTAAGNERIVIGQENIAAADFLPSECTLDWVIGGTATPTFTFSVGADLAS